jgi:hypothetical protein
VCVCQGGGGGGCDVSSARRNKIYNTTEMLVHWFILKNQDTYFD